MRSRSKRPKPDAPDELLQYPGLRMERRGRFTSVQTHRTPEEQKRLVKRIIDSRPQLLAEIGEANKELVDIAHKFNSLELLAQVWFANCVGDPDSYKEYSFEGRAHFVEHLAALELMDSEYKTRTLEMPGGSDIDRAQELLDKVFNKALFYYGSEALDIDNAGPISRLAQLRFDTILHELVIRNPTYYSHHADLLKELFGKDFIKAWTRRELSFDIGQALNCVQAIADLMADRLNERRDRARQFALDLKTYVDQWKKNGRFVGPEKAREITNRIRNMRSKEAKKTIRAAAVSWAFYQLHDTSAFNPEELADKAGVDLEGAKSFLRHFSLKFGSTPGDYLLPQPTSPLRSHPIINFGDKYFCPTSNLLIWALKPQLEAFIKPGGSRTLNADAKLWERYQRYRSDLLLQLGLSHFSKLLPNSKCYRNLHYRVVEEGMQKAAELDGLLLFDRYVFLIEAKAGELSPSAKRGGKLRMISDLKELVEDPHQQALRAKAYISGVEKSTFHLEDNSVISLEKKDYAHFFLVTLTLDNIDVFTKELYQLGEVGVLKSDELPWAISIDDLRIIAETISIPTQFTHYLKWRLHLNQRIRVTAQSELDWLGYYLSEGPKLLSVPDGYDHMMLQTYTTEFDDFYLYEQGEKTIRAPRPSQFCPTDLAMTLRSLEDSVGHGYSAASEALLNLTFEERKSFALCIRELSAAAKKGLSIEKTLVGEEVVVVLYTDSGRDCNGAARTAARDKGRTAVVLELDTKDIIRVTAWGACEVSRRVGGAETQGVSHPL